MSEQIIKKSNQQGENDRKTNTENGKSLNKKKEIYIYIGTIGIVFIVLAIMISFITSKTNKPKSESEKVINYIESLGKDFYETYYYPQLSKLKENNMIEGSIEEYLHNFEKTGIPVSLNRIMELHVKTEESIDKELEKFDCNYDETKFVIYPQSPYDKNSYKITPYIVCNNLKAEEK